MTTTTQATCLYLPTNNHIKHKTTQEKDRLSLSSAISKHLTMRLSNTALSLLLATSRTSAFGAPSFNSRNTRSLASLSDRANTSLGLSNKDRQLKYLHFTTNSLLPAPFALSKMSCIRGGSTSTGTALNSAVSAPEEAAPVEYFRADYQPLSNIVSKINMDFDITDGKTTVTSEMFVEANPNGPGAGDLVLDGDETCVKLMSVQMDEKDLVEGTDYELSPGKLVIKKNAFNGDSGSGVLKTVVDLVPEENTQLSGE